MYKSLTVDRNKAVVTLQIMWSGTFIYSNSKKEQYQEEIRYVPLHIKLGQ